MDEATKVTCPVCDASYRLKRFTPGKIYSCKKCGTELPVPERAIAAALPGRLPDGRHDERLDDIARSIEQLTRLTDGLAQRLDVMAQADAAQPTEDLSSVCRQLSEAAEKMDAPVSEKLAALESRLDDLARGMEPAAVAELAGQIKETGKALLDKLEHYDEARRRDEEDLILRVRSETVTGQVNMDDVVEKLTSGLRSSMPRLDPDQPSAVDALARVADELVREQSANTARLDKMTEELRTAVASISDLGAWRSGLPEQVADEIGHSVESRVVGPISTALAKQAPAIFSELQDNKLVDIVARSVREAQRPLLREVLAGAGRGGVPAWLFAALLLPLLLILGYLFLPGEWAQNEQAARTSAEIAAVTESLYRLEAAGVPMTTEDEERLRKIEDVVTDLHGQALAHAANAAALEEEAKGLRETLGERDRLIKEYSDMLQRQVRRIRAYEARLTRLGVTPDTVEDQPAP